ncbi:F-box protein PP2-A13 [Rhynchospora pubera]|uniref:F-box protein PP2-A13 n=1 Tax=Rhynchospora pubera TaxID=906938 RepID=A0AAV8CZ01_9POAL|nr:F-box protein PP2-A13 [Rhynchospora pubera]
MGAGVSSIMGPDGEVSYGDSGLGDMPESCVAAVLLYLDAPEICSVARLNRTFRGAASADFVWETKLPTNYEYLMGLIESGEEGEGEKRGWLSKKEIYAMLCRPHPFDGGGRKEFWLEKSKGGLCMAISSRAMVITGIDDRRYWNYIPTEESRFHSVAYLQQIWWFEVVGEIDFLFQAGSYSLYFRLHLGKPSKRLGRRIWSAENVHGWDIKPVRFHLSTLDGQQATSLYHLEEPGNWILYHIGDFTVPSESMEPVKLKFSMTQIDCTHTKGGLCVDSLLVYPKGHRPDKDTVVSL